MSFSDQNLEYDKGGSGLARECGGAVMGGELSLRIREQARSHILIRVRVQGVLGLAYVRRR